MKKILLVPALVMFAAAPTLAQNPSAANPANSDIGLSQTTKDGAVESSEQGRSMAPEPMMEEGRSSIDTGVRDQNIRGEVGGVDQDASTSATPPGPAAGGTD
jgi:hypothetical protein